MTRITLEQLLHNHMNETYKQQYDYIMGLQLNGRVRPLKASGTNGKRPALFWEYWLLEEKNDYRVLKEELKYKLIPRISVDYYLAHPDAYEQERSWVMMLNEYLRDNQEALMHQKSANERSFEIWNREKFLTKEQGKKILKRCGLELKDLNIYGTTEPLSYYCHTREVPQNLLILENKDTFYSMRRHLLKGGSQILGVRVGTLIYGAGKGILRSFRDFDLCVEPYMKDQRNRIYYFGDLDYEGIGIYENLTGLSGGNWKILPFRPAYQAMLKKAEAVKQLPETKELQNQNIRDIFFDTFDEGLVYRMKRILEDGKYIPQEILSITDF